MLTVEPAEVLEFSEQNWRDIITPINVKEFGKLLHDSGYDQGKARYLICGFAEGFDIGYRGPKQRRDQSENIPIKLGVGSPLEMWNKVMKEVKAKALCRAFPMTSHDLLCAITTGASTQGR